MVLAREMEVVYGDIRVAARLSIGMEYLRLFFTDRRIIVAHIGKRNVGSPAMTSFFGRFSSALEDLFRSGGESVAKRGLNRSPPDEILAADRDNFFIDYADVVSVDVFLSQSPVRLVIVTGDEKFVFTTKTGPALLELLQKTLDRKVRVG